MNVYASAVNKYTVYIAHGICVCIIFDISGVTTSENSAAELGTVINITWAIISPMSAAPMTS